MVEWEIDNVRFTLTLQNEPDKITGLLWLAKAEDGEFKVEQTGLQEFGEDAAINDTPYPDVTEDQCLATLFELMGPDRKANIEAAILRNLARQGIPEHGFGKPWKGSKRQWRVGLDVVTDEYLVYKGVYYRVLQDHTTQSDWPPDKTPALFTQETPPDQSTGPEAWVQPTGAHDAYGIGDRVTHQGSTWESQHASNVWEPGAPGTDTLWTEVI